jgi:hypothetical protein
VPPSSLAKSPPAPGERQPFMNERSMVAKCTSVSCSLLDIPVGWLRLLLTPYLWQQQQQNSNNNFGLLLSACFGVWREEESLRVRWVDRRTSRSDTLEDICRFSRFHTWDYLVNGISGASLVLSEQTRLLLKTKSSTISTNLYGCAHKLILNPTPTFNQ